MSKGMCETRLYDQHFIVNGKVEKLSGDIIDVTDDLNDWFNRHMNWGHKEPIEEQDFKLLSNGEHAVWNADHPKPEGGDAYERKLTKWIAKRDAKLVKKMSTDKMRWSAERWDPRRRTPDTPKGAKIHQ